MKKQLEIPFAELCEYCKDGAIVPGAIFPIASDGWTDHAYVEKCDECEVFSDDDTAANAVAARLKKRVWYDKRKHPYVTGFTMDSAEKLRKKIVRDRRAKEPQR